MKLFDLVDMRKTRVRNFVAARWVCTVKKDKDGNFQKCKARWVLKGFQDKQKKTYNKQIVPPHLELDSDALHNEPPTSAGIYSIWILKPHSGKVKLTMNQETVYVRYHLSTGILRISEPDKRSQGTV